MPSFSITHLTDYRYQRFVAFGEHRMMLRPRDDEDQRVVQAVSNTRLDHVARPFLAGDKTQLVGLLVKSRDCEVRLLN
jgi:hypothetical protein